jgi:hypothetical protein
MKEKLEEYDGNLLEFMSLFEDENEQVQKLLNSFLKSYLRDLRRSRSLIKLDNIFYKETDSEFVFAYIEK